VIRLHLWAEVTAPTTGSEAATLACVEAACADRVALARCAPDLPQLPVAIAPPASVISSAAAAARRHHRRRRPSVNARAIRRRWWPMSPFQPLIDMVPPSVWISSGRLHLPHRAHMPPLLIRMTGRLVPTTLRAPVTLISELLLIPTLPPSANASSATV